MSRVAFLALWFLPQVGGMEMSSYEIVKAIKTSGNDVIVATADHRNCYEFDKKQDFKIYRAKGVFLSNLAPKNGLIRAYYYVSYYVKFYKVVRNIVKVYKPDTIIIADEQTRNWYGFFAHRFKYKPVVIASMPEKRHQRLKVRIVSKTLEQAKDILCVSKSTLDKMCETFGEKYRSKMSVLYRSINDDVLYQAIDVNKVQSIKEKYNLINKTVILSVCRLSRKKGLEYLLKAISHFDDSLSIVVLIVGEGPDEERLRQLTHELGIEDRVVFTGRIERDEIISFYDSCDLFVLPSEEESFGRVYAEAGARKKACIGCNVGGVPEVISNNCTGILIPPHDVEELKNKIELLINNSEIKSLMEENAYQQVQDKYNFSRLTSFWKEYLKNVDKG